MSPRIRIKGLIALLVVTAGIVGGSVLIGTTQAEAARCCWVMVCDNTGCWEVCRTCPKFP